MSTSKAYERGDADRYYGRPYNPNMWLDDLGAIKVYREEMTKQEILDYDKGWTDNPSGQKDWK